MQFFFSESRNNKNLKDSDEDKGFASKTLKASICKHFHALQHILHPAQHSYGI